MSFGLVIAFWGLVTGGYDAKLSGEELEMAGILCWTIVRVWGFRLSSAS